MKINLYLGKKLLLKTSAGVTLSFCFPIWPQIFMKLFETVVFKVLTILLLSSMSERLHEVQNFWGEQIDAQKNNMIAQDISFQKIKLTFKYGTCKLHWIVWRKDKPTPAFSSK